MELIISMTPTPSKYVSTFVIEARFMHGDADSYTTREWESPRQDAIKLALSALSEVREETGLPDWYQRQNDQMWDDAEAQGIDADEGLYLLDHENGMGIPRDNEYCDTPAHLEHYNLYYYDGEGTKYPVEVVL